MISPISQTEVALLACRLLVKAWTNANATRLDNGDILSAVSAAHAALHLGEASFIDRAAAAYAEEIDR